MKKIITALLTPFDEKGQLNESGLRQLVRYNIDEMKVDGLYIGGSTGESFLMNEATKRDVFQIVKDEAKDHVMLIAQIGSLDIDEAIRLGKECKELGYDALSAITPYYYKFSFEEIKNYYERLTRETNHSMLIYSNPAFTGAQFTIEQYGELLAIDHVMGVKYTDVDLAKLSKLKSAYSDKVFYSGSDDMVFQFAESGADGAIGSTYNIIGLEAKKIYKLLEEKELEQAHQMQLQMNDIIDTLLELGVYQTIKHVLKEKGIEAGFMKFPFKELNQREKELATTLVDKVDTSKQQV
ncbi:N-acetylneuraminate lyase [Alteribacter populi]|uniref:N-acetylneuraminate lyase n=1 Tax=Alteribacter populi TaxID=2011011 RepID=UPI000BBB0C67|nr:N-acetylneuraminate lyase [Alteribacter populi]